MLDSPGTCGRKPYPERKKLRIQKYPDKCGRGLSQLNRCMLEWLILGCCLLIHSFVRLDYIRLRCNYRLRVVSYFCFELRESRVEHVWGASGEAARKESGSLNLQSRPQPDLDIWWRHPHLQNGAHAEKHEGRSLPGSLLRLEVSFPHTTLRAVTLDNEKSGVWRKNAVRWTFVRSWEVKRPNTRVFQLKEMPDKAQNI